MSCESCTKLREELDLAQRRARTRMWILEGIGWGHPTDDTVPDRLGKLEAALETDAVQIAYTQGIEMAIDILDGAGHREAAARLQAMLDVAFV